MATFDATLVDLRSRHLDLKHEHDKLDATWKEHVQRVKHWQKEVRYHLLFVVLSFVICSSM